MRDVAAIVVTYNRKRVLRECIERLLRSERAVCDILIVDNNSTDNTKEYISTLVDGSSVYYFNTGKNIGGAGGFNYGMKIAMEKGYDYIWLMDDDTYVNPDTLARLLDADRELDGKYGFLSSVAYWTDGSICVMNRQRTDLINVVQNYKDKYVPVIMATFVSFFVRSDVVGKYGFPISKFFIWSDDLEYSRRISKNIPGYVVNGSTVVHCMGSNNKVGIEQEAHDRLWRYEYMYRNEFYLYRREGIYGMLIYVARILLHSLRIVLKAGDKRKKLRVIWTSFAKGFRFKPEVEYFEAAEWGNQR